MYDDIHLNTAPDNPKLFSSRDIKVEWQTVSKAAERSRATAKVEVPASMDL
jgi:orotate phosphoribosyltransferase-like protein